jgi:hypothetical protein
MALVPQKGSSKHLQTPLLSQSFVKCPNKKWILLVFLQIYVWIYIWTEIDAALI